MSFALALLEATARAKRVTLEAIASDVVDGRYSFEPRRTVPRPQRLGRP